MIQTFNAVIGPILLGTLICASTSAAWGQSLFHAPKKVLAAGQPLDVKRSGHSAPFVGDFDGDGLDDLLVGQFHEGKLRIYRNTGDSQKPKFSSFEWFSGKVPSG